MRTNVTGVKPVYLPTVDPDSNWQQGATCTTCHLLPKKNIDLLQTVDGTWHDSTYTPGDLAHTINTPFSGTAIYVFFIVPNTVANTITYVNLTFLIDNTFSNSYEHIPDATSTILYNTLVFHATNLTNTEHNIEVRASGANSSLLMFDYMLYTVDEDDPSSSTLGSASATTLPASSNSPNPSPPGVERDSRSSPPIGAIAGGVVGGVVVLSALLVLLCCLRKQRYRGFVPPRFTNWSKKPPVSLPTTTPMADAYNSPATALARPVTHPHAPSLPVDNIGRAGWSTTASYSDTPPLQPPHGLGTPSSKEFHSVESESMGVRRRDSLSSPSAYTGSSRTTDPALRAQVTLLQEELGRLRADQREMHALLIEPPPVYPD
ncbi:uncharacterized protein TRAVEDRAFT_41344 [Trametes versicolor FP-101664 SS1]|uniref:uncharacterized protein n=1 Tax=Trametes versicolor (strain FP-101664) TaxID=717944 RepID=UPI000462321A|nr:uncharacterized protein TRAVEDRAFT_41344 [Trametes versicolor FP-101664 SS1]EIW63918.1 hypothetical protein TRAVEDRAFT_41344 [Trametes versicolor FP-101664 SS1]